LKTVTSRTTRLNDRWRNTGYGSESMIFSRVINLILRDRFPSFSCYLYSLTCLFSKSRTDY
jgi:hypothetical protein